MNATGSPGVLPLDQAWPEIESALRSHVNLVLVAEPGAGKTTRFPPLLLRSGLLAQSSRVLMLEPRRLAARAAATRIAEENRFELGAEVGYQVRFENRTSAQTRLVVLTEGLLTRRLQSDGGLKDVGAVLLDEFHERSQHTDLSLGLLFELQQLSRPDLRLIVMSATLDASRVSRYLGNCPIVQVPGRTYPIEVFNGAKPLVLETGLSFFDEVSTTIQKAVMRPRANAGDLLVFLPGVGEIRGVRKRLESMSGLPANLEICELHGGLSLEEQNRAIQKRAATKVILTTNIAETSLTIDGVDTVIDSGLARLVRIDGAGFERLQLARISLASATQRAGRAGRQGPGVCFRLWSQLDENSMPEFETPELLRIDLTDTVMALMAAGVHEPTTFSWFEAPPREALRTASETLTRLGFRNPQTGQMTAEGREAATLPLPARLQKLLIESIKYEHLKLGAELAALLSERDIASPQMDLKRQAAVESDAVLRLHLLHSSHPSAVARVARISEAVMQIARRIHKKSLGAPRAEWLSLNDDELALRLLLAAFPDRVCRRRRAGEPAARMLGGKGVLLSPHSSVERAEFFVALGAQESQALRNQLRSASAQDTLISMASRIEKSWLEKFDPTALGQQVELVFDAATERVQKQITRLYGDLPLGEPHLEKPDHDEVFGALKKAVAERFAKITAEHPALAQLLRRLEFLQSTLAATQPDLDWPSCAPEKILDGFLDEVCYQKSRLSEIMQLPLAEIYLRHLPAWASQLLAREAPEALIVPSGSRLPIQYPREREPYLEVRIQEVFGLAKTPRLGGGSVSLVLHLLGPNFRPVQVTSDLESFWKNGYNEVRKELRTRYPKHSWPEDPLSARPEAKGRRRTPP